MEIEGRRVVLFGQLAEPMPNQPGEATTVAIAVVADGGVFEALELDAEGRFIAPYDWPIVSLDGFAEDNQYGVRGWINRTA